MPDDVMAIVLGKYTYARCGISCLATPLEAGWEGHITLEFANTTPSPAKLYANEGAAQLIFFKSDGRPYITYADRKGKYQKQTGITLPKMK
jgi:dCTP deaminase